MTLGDAASATGSWLSRLRRRLSLSGAESAASAELENPAGSSVDKQALREVIERKRHHDLVRQREFDHLRQLRRRNLNHTSEPAHAPTSRFETSILVPVEERESGERETTLRKIDEIEARLSRQWWRQAPSSPPDAAALDPAQPAASPLLPDTTLPAAPPDSSFAVTQSADSTLPPPPPVASPPARVALPPGLASPRKPSLAANPLTDPALQEAALRFVNDDLTPAETILLTALRAPVAPPPALTRLWLGGLLDLYRHSGQTAAAARAWQAFGACCPQPTWKAPALLDQVALVQLEQATGAASPPIWLDWQALRAIAPEALDLLAGQLAHWCTTPLHLRWRGQAQLTQALRALTPLGEREAGAAAWQARLDALRLLGLRDEFELVALEYCTTFALPPPQWQEARSRCTLDADALAAWADATPLELSGDLRGDLQPALAAWPTDPAQAPRLAISCARLERLDFLAAGSLYLWLAAYRAHGGQALLHEVHPLMAAFLQLCGLGEQAQIVPCQGTE